MPPLHLIACGSLVVLCLLLGLTHLADAAGVPPGVGSFFQQAHPKRAPAPSGTNTGLTTSKIKAGRVKSKLTFEIKVIRITGNTRFSTGTLHALVSSDEGKKLTLGQLHQLAGKITGYYRSHGYPLARALIPAQIIRNGVIRIKVLEARYGKIKLNNRSRVIDRLLQATIAPLKSGEVVGGRKLNRALLLLSDIPGISVNAALKSGAMVDTSDLDVNIGATPMVEGNLSADNYGNQYTGLARVGAEIRIANPLHFGDELTLSGLSSGRDLVYGRAGYDAVVNGYGTRFGAAYSALHYILGGSLSNMGGYGTARIVSGWMRQPLLRGRRINLHAQVQYDYQHLRDRVDVARIRTDRDLMDWVGSISGDARDGFLSGAINSWSLSWTAGRVSFKDATAQASDAATARTSGRFYKWDGSFARLQGLGAKTSLYLAVSGQWTTYNLDSLEKLVVGGPYDVRAYDVGMLSADTGYRGTVELQRRLGYGFQAKLFFDSEHVIINHRPWVTGKNMATLSGVGAGVDWSGAERLHVEGVIAWPVGPTPELLGSRSNIRGWVRMIVVF